MCRESVNTGLDHPVQELSPLQVLQKSGNYSTKSTGKSSMIINPARTELDPARPIAPRAHLQDPMSQKPFALRPLRLTRQATNDEVERRSVQRGFLATM